MLTIRLTRKGKKNQPFFRVVVIDKRRSSKGGRAVEVLGYVDPLTKRRSFEKERILYWIKNGAQPSVTAHNLLVSEKIIEGKKINVTKKSKKPAATAPEVAVAPETTSEKPLENPPVSEAPADSTSSPQAEQPPAEPENPSVV